MLDVNKNLWQKELSDIEEFYKKLGEKVPKELRQEFDSLKNSICEEI